MKWYYAWADTAVIDYLSSINGMDLHFIDNGGSRLLQVLRLDVDSYNENQTAWYLLLNWRIYSLATDRTISENNIDSKPTFHCLFHFCYIEIFKL